MTPLISSEIFPKELLFLQEKPSEPRNAMDIFAIYSLVAVTLASRQECKHPRFLQAGHGCTGGSCSSKMLNELVTPCYSILRKNQSLSYKKRMEEHSC